MSVALISNKQIDYVLTAVKKIHRESEKIYLKNRVYQLSNNDHLEMIGNHLKKENVISWNERYPEDKIEIKEDMYIFNEYTGKLDLNDYDQIHKALNCLEYNSFNEEFLSSLAYRFYHYCYDLLLQKIYPDNTKKWFINE